MPSGLRSLDSKGQRRSLTAVFLLGLVYLAGQGCSRVPSDPKLALVDRVDRALRAEDADALLALVLEPDPGTRCPGLPFSERETTERAATRRERARLEVRACLALAEWGTAEHLALNYGSRIEAPRLGCRDDFREMEKSELYYATGDDVRKVTLDRPVLTAEGARLTTGLHCAAKTGSAAEFEEPLTRVAGNGMEAALQARAVARRLSAPRSFAL